MIIRDDQEYVCTLQFKTKLADDTVESGTVVKPVGCFTAERIPYIKLSKSKGDDVVVPLEIFMVAFQQKTDPKDWSYYNPHPMKGKKS